MTRSLIIISLVSPLPFVVIYHCVLHIYYAHIGEIAGVEGVKSNMISATSKNNAYYFDVSHFLFVFVFYSNFITSSTLSNDNSCFSMKSARTRQIV